MGRRGAGSLVKKQSGAANQRLATPPGLFEAEFPSEARHSGVSPPVVTRERGTGHSFRYRDDCCNRRSVGSPGHSHAESHYGTPADTDSY